MPRYNIKDCLYIANSKDGKCLSLQYKSTTTKMKWECKEGHQWETTFKIIKKNTWCPDCSKIISRSLYIGLHYQHINIRKDAQEAYYFLITVGHFSDIGLRLGFSKSNKART